MNIFPSVWGSLVKVTNEIITEANTLHPEAGGVHFIDWEAHANIQELPDFDLIGPSSLVVMETAPQFFDVNFALAVSTYETDKNLFRLRHYVSMIFERFRVLKQLTIYDDITATPYGYLIFGDGTGVMPMTRATARPWQYVQVSGHLEPGNYAST